MVLFLQKQGCFCRLEFTCYFDRFLLWRQSGGWGVASCCHSGLKISELLHLWIQFFRKLHFFVNSIPVNFKRIQKQVLPGGWVFKMLFWRKKNSWENHFIRKITTVELTDKMWLFFLFSVLLVVNADPLIQNDQPDLNIKNINDIGPNKVINLFF